MSANTKIEWCDHSWSPWRGCTKVSAGCAHCYAETLSKRNPKVLGEWGRGKPRVMAKNWSDPVKWNVRGFICRECGKAQHADRCCSGHCSGKTTPQTVFPSLCDWLDEEVPTGWLARFLQLIHDTPHLTWLLLTKRPENFESRIDAAYEHSHGEGWQSLWTQGEAPANVWVGTSVENQEYADRRIPALLKIPAVGRFLSLEPLLGPVRVWDEGFIPADEDGPERVGYMVGKDDGRSPLRVTPSAAMAGINWLIIGGESGHGARPCNLDWIRSLIAQGKAAEVRTFVKQLGARPLVNWPMAGNDGSAGVVEVGKTVAFTDCSGAAAGTVKQFSHPKGGNPDEWPADVRVRQYPVGLR